MYQELLVYSSMKLILHNMALMTLDNYIICLLCLIVYVCVWTGMCLIVQVLCTCL